MHSREIADRLLDLAREAKASPEGRARLLSGLCETMRVIDPEETVIVVPRVIAEGIVAAARGITEASATAHDHADFLIEIMGAPRR